MKLSALFDPAALDSNVEGGYIRMQTHPEYPHLGILNYTEKAQFDNHWDAVTLRCRGLVFDGPTEDVVALPFPKFFNWDQQHPDDRDFQTGPIEVFEKADGSLGIFFNYDGYWLCATRGSFASDQAQWAQSWLNGHIVNGDGQFLDPNVTYLAEIIYPQNRIVVDYDGLEDCVLLGGYDRRTGDEIDLYYLKQVWPGPSARVIKDFETLDQVVQSASDSSVKGTEREGYIVKFRDNGQRVKVKFVDYKNIHGVFTNTTEKTIWSLLASGQNISDIAEIVPDELHRWCRGIADDLDRQHTELVASVYAARQAAMDGLNEHNVPYDRKQFALMAKKVVEPRLMKAVFLALDNNAEKLANWAWRQIEPSHGGRRPGGRTADPEA